MKNNGVYSTPSASNLTQTMLHDLAEDLISTVQGLPLECKRAPLSPSKSHSKGKKAARDDLANLPTLDDDDKDLLHFTIECIRCWLPPSGDCFGVSLPPTVSWPLAAHHILHLHVHVGRCCYYCVPNLVWNQLRQRLGKN